jgi:hypothetical protein
LPVVEVLSKLEVLLSFTTRILMNVSRKHAWGFAVMRRLSISSCCR